MEPIILTVALGVVGAAIMVSWLTKRTNGQLPPGPRGFNFYRDFVKAVASQTTHIEFGKWAKEYGEIFSISLPGQKMIVLNSAEAVRQVFNGPTKNITNDRPPTFLGKYLFMNSGISFIPMGKLWRRLRQLFHTSINLHVEGGKSIEETLRLGLVSSTSHLKGTSVTDHVDICDVVSHYLMTVLHILMTGERPPPGSKNVELMKEMDYHLNKFLALDTDTILVRLPFLRFLPNSYGRRWREMVATTKKINEIFYQDYHKNFKNGEEGVINKYIEAMTRFEGLVTENQVRAVIIELIAAGYVSSKVTLTAMILLVLHKPEVQEKLHEEIDAVLGDRPPCLHDQHNMPYFGAFFLEVMRYTSLIPSGFPHFASEDFEYKGYHIPKDSVIIPNLFYADHDDTHWENPWEFKPERFLKSDGQLAGPLDDVRKRVITFGVGKRSCPGEGFARSRMFMFMTTLFQQFELLPPEDKPLPSCHPSDWEPGLLLLPRQFQCRLRHRQASQREE